MCLYIGTKNKKIKKKKLPGLILCKLASCVSILAVSVSVLTLVAISWDRSKSWSTSSIFIYIQSHICIIYHLIFCYPCRYNAIMSPLKPRLSKMKTSLIAGSTWCLGGATVYPFKSKFQFHFRFRYKFSFLFSLNCHPQTAGIKNC